jgi:hypothetical protein
VRGRSLALALAPGLALLAGCGQQPPRTDLHVDIWNGDGTSALARPNALTLSWLDSFGFLVKDKSFAVPPGMQPYLGSVVVSVYTADLEALGQRRVLVHGLVGATPVSEGWAMFEPGQPEPPISITLQAGADVDDADGDGIPDPIDNCPQPNPDQQKGDC